MIPLFLFAIVNVSFGFILVDYDCSKYTTNFVYNESAVSCTNNYADSTCESTFPKANNVEKYPTPGRNDARPSGCFSVDGGNTIFPTMKYSAVSYCPKTCGFCCLKQNYNCINAAKPAVQCETLTDAQCKSPAWREFVAANCPATCGFCREQGCFDAIVNCSDDPSICTDSKKDDYANRYCRKTCNRCGFMPTRSPTGI